MSLPLALVLSVGLLAGVSKAQSPREITFGDIVRPKAGEWPSYNGQLEREPAQPARSHQHEQRRDARADVDATRWEGPGRFR